MSVDAPLSAAQIEQAKQAIIAQYGPWTAHNIHLGHGIYTLDNQSARDIRPRWLTQIVADIARRPWTQLRILDLACLEGWYAIECALQGAEVVGIEGRKASVEKARLVKDIHRLDRLTFYQDDVRNLSVANYGQFDVILCLGILYHLDAPDVFAFIEQLAACCRGFAIVDTHISLTPAVEQTYQGQTYWGEYYQEHAEAASPAEREQAAWASLDNPKSFWLTRPSLVNCLQTSGFTSVYECYKFSQGFAKQGVSDRLALLAMRGTLQTVYSSPLVEQLGTGTWPESQPAQTPAGD
ncbi:class I SAM-dependent methyltransferase [Trichothermofontia sp.]